MWINYPVIQIIQDANSKRLKKKWWLADVEHAHKWIAWSWKYKSKLMPAMKEKCKRDGLVEHDTKHHCFKYVFFKHCWLVTRKIGKYLSTQYILLIILGFFKRSIAVCHWWMVNVMALLLFSQGFCCVCFPFKITEKKGH